ncbi:FAD/NAD(P)-binding domain-containing protein [Trametopsis cervina]|nr:FAD/NAD(P)-binding domain-containing protein [Trametopsis cervina]
MADNTGSTANDHLMQIHFLVVGGGVAGYACAVALSRAGHRVTLLDLENALDLAWGPYGICVPPNFSKLLVRWGMGDELKACGTALAKIKIADYHTGEDMGFHNWQKEMLKDAGGDVVYANLSDVRRILHARALSHQAVIRSGVKVTSISVAEGLKPSARLTTGEVIEADVIIGADGSDSMVRREIIGQELRETPLGLTVFNVRIPREKMTADPELTALLEHEETAVTWLGIRYSALAYVVGKAYNFFVYTPTSGTEEYWRKPVPKEFLLKIMGQSTPTLQKLANAATEITCAPLNEPPEVEQWRHSHGRVILVGDAAHPFPRTATHAPAMNAGDAAFLGMLFANLTKEDQIDSFLAAYESSRRDRVKLVRHIELANLYQLAMPAGVEKDMRDTALKEKVAAGLDAFAQGGGDLAAQQWDLDKMLFAYDAEDHAAEWWNDWGLLKERATDAVRVPKARIPVMYTAQHIHAENSDSQ